LLEQISIVLVSTSHPGNIGGAARAMKNMGLGQLVLVQPKEFPHAEATARAAGADDVLAGAKVVGSLAEAVAPCHFVVGTSARQRTVSWPLCAPRQSVEKMLPILQAGQRVAVVFGNEQSGLSNEELALCHLHLHIPCEAQFSSLNVAAAVQIVTYELRLMQLAALPDSTSPVVEDEKLVTVAEMEQFYTRLEQVLLQIRYLKPNNPGKLMLRLRRLFNRAMLEAKEMQILRGLLNSIDDRMQEDR
jgi:tRNA (cytidine32/uridine32-2'-O)-methyltransferase